MPQAPITLNGASLIADLSGALWWPERRTLVVADLHLEKGSSYAARGRPLPPYDTAATLDRLEAAAERFGPERVVCLGDSFHDQSAAARLPPGEVLRLRRLTVAHDWIWIAGNHDPEPPPGWGGAAHDELTIGPLVFRHAARTGAGARGAVGEVSGHYHPKATVRVRHGRAGGRCFAGDGSRLILPAFGAYAGGLDVLDPAIAGLFRRRFTVHLLGGRRLHAFPSERLSGGEPRPNTLAPGPGRPAGRAAGHS